MTSGDKLPKLSLLGLLYTSQMLGLSFLITALPAILRELDMGLDKIGWIYALGFIWSLKFLWAPLVDRYGLKRYGHYRSWIVICQLLLVGLLVIISCFTIKDDFMALVVLFAFLPFISATQDIASDALAVTILGPYERAVGNAVQTSGNLAGALFGGGLILIIYKWFGWQVSLLALAVLTAVPLVGLFAYKEKPAPADVRQEKVSYKELVLFFKRSGMWGWVPILLTFGMSNTIAYGLLGPLLVDKGWELDKIGFYINVVGPALGIVGAVLCGMLANRLRRKPVMLIAMALTILSMAGLWGFSEGMMESAMMTGVSIALMMTSYGCSSTIMYTTIMDKSSPDSAGTDFSVQMSLSRIPTFVCGGMAMGMAQSSGYTAVLMCLIAISFISALMICFYRGLEVTS